MKKYKNNLFNKLLFKKKLPYFIAEIGVNHNGNLELAKKMIRLSGLQLGRDIQIVHSGLRHGEKLDEELLADKEKTMHNTHPKITIAKIRTTSLKDVEIEMTKLPELVENNDNDSIVNSLKNLVEEYSTDLLTETKEES